MTAKKPSLHKPGARTEERFAPYEGELATPLEQFPDHIPLMNEQDTKYYLNRILTDRLFKKLYRHLLLLKHYNIDPKSPNHQQQLLLALIEHHVPGFQAAKPKDRGRPVEWTRERKFALFCSVRFFMACGLNKTDALRKVHGEDTFRAENVESLRKQYDKICNDPESETFDFLIKGNFATEAGKAEGWLALAEINLSAAGIKSD